MVQESVSTNKRKTFGLALLKLKKKLHTTKNSHTKHKGFLRREIPTHMAVSTLLSVTAGKHSQKVSNVIEAFDNISHFTLIKILRTPQLRTVEYCFKCI